VPEEIYRIRRVPDSIVQKLNIDHSQIKSMRFLGLIAQEVDQALYEIGWLDFPGIDRPKSDDELYSLRYGDFVIPLIKAVQEQQQMIDAQKQQIATLQKENEELKARLQNETAKLQSETEVLKAENEQMRKRLELLERLVLDGTTQPETLGAK
jgi:predicted nuclease with TOPRIM domain